MKEDINMSNKEKLLKYIDNPELKTGQNMMGCSENWYNHNYAIMQTFTKEEIMNMDDSEIDHLIKLADNISAGLY